jgi:hypothetical protein
MWEIVEQAAAMQEAILEQCRVEGVQPLAWYAYPFADLNYHQLAAKWHLPTDFLQAVRTIMEENSNISFTGYVGELWDRNSFFLRRRHWALDQWTEEWRDKVLAAGIRTESGKKSIARYQIEQWGFRTTHITVRNGVSIRDPQAMTSAFDELEHCALFGKGRRSCLLSHCPLVT